MSRKMGWMALALCGLMGCNPTGVKGNGEIKNETRKVGAFSSISASGAYRLEVQVGRPSRLTLRSDSNLLPLVETTIQDGQLQVRSLKNLRPTDGVTVTASTPSLERVAVSGAAKGQIAGVTGQRFAVKLSGAGNLTLAGKTEQLDVSISGAGQVLAAGLEAARVKVGCSGAGNVEVNAAKTLEVNLSGAGKVAYHGDPKVTKRVSGVGSVVKK